MRAEFCELHPTSSLLWFGYTKQTWSWNKKPMLHWLATMFSDDHDMVCDSRSTTIFNFFCSDIHQLNIKKFLGEIPISSESVTTIHKLTVHILSHGSEGGGSEDGGEGRVA